MSKKPIQTSGQLTVSVALGESLLLTAQLSHLATIEGQSNHRHNLRAIRSRAMVEVALAWADPEWRRRWREGGG